MNDMITFCSPICRLMVAAVALMIGIGIGPTARGQIPTTVDVNSAEVASLTSLPGITPTIANRIVKGRPFHTLKELGEVKGVTAAKLDALAGRVTFGSNVVVATSENTSARTSMTPALRKTGQNKVGPGEKI